MFVVADDVLAATGEEDTGEGERQDHAVQGTDDDENFRRAADGDKDRSGDDDERDDDIAIVVVDGLPEGAEEGDGRVGRADDRGDGDASAAGFLGSSVAPVTTTPRMARKRR